MCAEEGIDKRLHMIVVLQIETPIIRKWDNWVDIDFQTAQYISQEGLMLRVRAPPVDSQFNLLKRSTSFPYHLVTDCVLFSIDGVPDVRVELSILAIYTAYILIKGMSTSFLLHVIFREMKEIDLIWQSRI